MADNESSKTGMLGVLIGALIVILAGGGILLATGALDTKPTNVTITQPAAAPAPATPDRSDRDGRRDDRRGEWRGDRDHDRNRDKDRDRDGSDRR